MKTQPADTDATHLGPFSKLMLILAEQRAHTENEVSTSALTKTPFSAVAVTAALGEVANGKQPVCGSPLVLGPFLTTVLMLAERGAAGYPRLVAQLDHAGEPAVTRACRWVDEPGSRIWPFCSPEKP